MSAHPLASMLGLIPEFIHSLLHSFSKKRVHTIISDVVLKAEQDVTSDFEGLFFMRK